MPNNLDDVIRGTIRAYGNARGKVVPASPSGAQVGQGNIGGRNARNRGKPAYPDHFNQLAPKANTNDDEGFQIQSEPLAEADMNEKFLKPLAAAAALSMAMPTGEAPHAQKGMGDVALAGGKEIYSDVDHWVSDASHETGVQEAVLRALIHVESRGIHDAESNVGAYGLTQLMPDTAKMVGVTAQNPQQNVLGGARYIQFLAKMYRGDVRKVVAAYNGGPSRLNTILRQNPGASWDQIISMMPSQTQDYVPQMLQKMRGIKKITFKKKMPWLQEGHGAGVSQFPTDLSGKQQQIPALDDAILKNDGDPKELNVPGSYAGLTELVGRTLRRMIGEARQTQVGVTVGNFQPFHKGHAAVIRKLATQLPKVVVFVQPGKPFSHQTTMNLMNASLPDVWDRLEIYPAQGDIQSSVQSVMGQQGSTLNQESQISFHQMPEDDEISAKRVREALQDDEKDMVRKMLDPHVFTEDSKFEQLYAQMRRELGASGAKPTKVITAAPTPSPEGVNEMSAGAMATTVGDTRTGRHGGSSWSSFNPRGAFIDDKEEDDDDINPPTRAAPGAGEQYQQMTRSPNRMLDMANPGVPDDHKPGGGELDHHLIDPDDEETPTKLTDPTDLSEMILRRLRNISKRSVV